MQQADVVVIGAGMAGLSCASALQARGKRVLVLEKARGTGGRLSSKRVKDQQGNDLGYDLGAPSFNASDARLVKRLQTLEEHGKVARISEGNGAGEWIGASRNSALTRGMAVGLNIQFSRRVTALEKRDDSWQVFAEAADNPGDVALIQAAIVVLACPPAQAAALAQHDHLLSRSLATARIEPQWVVMIATEQAGGLDSEARLTKLNGDDAMFSRVVLESAKRGDAESTPAIWQLHFTTDWSWRHADMQAPAVQAFAQQLWLDVFGEEVVASHVHRWLYSVCGVNSRPVLSGQYADRVADGCYFDPENALGLCGDYWLSLDAESGIESAFLSGLALAYRMG